VTLGSVTCPGQPAAYGTVFTLLRDLGFPMRTARISALRQLVLQAPAPVVAEALGFHHTTTQRQRANAAGSWAAIPAPTIQHTHPNRANSQQPRRRLPR
jgi:hypothetical protein